jgi:hypothetical protein
MHFQWKMFLQKYQVRCSVGAGVYETGVNAAGVCATEVGRAGVDRERQIGCRQSNGLYYKNILIVI